MGKSILSKIGTGLERVFVVDGTVVRRETLLAQKPVVGRLTVLEILKTDKGTVYLHSNLQESHTYFQCSSSELKDVAEKILQFVGNE